MIDVSERLDPEMAAVLALVRARAGEVADAWHTVPITELRRRYAEEARFWNAGTPAVAEVRELTLAGPYGDIPVRLYRPLREGTLPLVVYLHGGGWVVGDLDTHDRIMRRLALAGGSAVAGVAYRLAPEHKFPVAFDEAVAAVRGLAAEAETLGLDGTRIGLAGDSSGATLALAAGLTLKGTNGPHASALALVYGAYGLCDSRSRRLYAGAGEGLSEDDMAFYRDSLIRSPADLADPRLDLLRQDLAGVPPTCVIAAELDPLLDDSLTLAPLLEAAGVETRLTVYDGVLHAFLHLGSMVAKAEGALDEAGAWLARHLGGAQSR